MCLGCCKELQHKYLQAIGQLRELKKEGMDLSLR